MEFKALLLKIYREKSSLFVLSKANLLHEKIIFHSGKRNKKFWS
jgi:hypothetical protein